MKRRHLNWLSVSVSLLAVMATLFFSQYERAEASSGYRVFGRIIDGATQQALTNVEVQLYYDPLASGTNDDVVLISTNTDVNGYYSFDNLSGEMEGTARILELPDGYVVPLRETVRLSTLTSTNEVIF